MIPDRFQRQIARVLIVTMTSLALHPLSAAAAQTPAAGQAARHGHHRPLADLEDTLRQVAPQAWGRAEAERDDATLADAAQTLLEQDDAVELEAADLDTELARTEAELVARNLPPEILQRHLNRVFLFFLVR